MEVIKEIYDYRQMVYSLVRRDLRGRYKASVLGFLWTFINPLLQLVIYTIVFSVILKTGIDKYYLFLFVALVPWIFFQASISGGSSSIIAQQDLVKKIYFPREVIPISYVTSCFVNMLFSFIIIFIVVAVSGVKINFLGVLCLPLIMFIEYIMAVGFALIASAVTVYFRDLEHILGIVTMAWMYLTPIMYSIEMIPEDLRKVLMLNPMVPIINAYRDVLYYGRTPHLYTLLNGFMLGVISLVAGFVVFGKLKRHFAEEL
jgi:lipopolysaccharide transport system permease protein